MWRRILTHGLVAGGVVGVPLFGLTVARNGQPHDGVLLGYLTMLVALSAVFVAVKRQRDGEIRPGPGITLVPLPNHPAKLSAPVRHGCRLLPQLQQPVHKHRCRFGVLGQRFRA